MNRRTIGKLVVIAIILTIILSVTTMVKAESSAALVISSDGKLVEGSTITSTVKLQINDASAAIDTVVAKLNYDKNVFETVTMENMTAGSNWTLSYAESTNMFTLTKNAKVSNSEVVLTIKFKVKSTISTDTTKITLSETDLGGYDENNPTNIGNPTSIENAPDTSVVISKVGTPQQIVVTEKDSTTAQTQKLPQTGVSATTTIAMVVVATIGIASFVVYKKMTKEMK